MLKNAFPFDAVFDWSFFKTSKLVNERPLPEAWNALSSRMQERMGSPDMKQISGLGLTV